MDVDEDFPFMTDETQLEYLPIPEGEIRSYLVTKAEAHLLYEEVHRYFGDGLRVFRQKPELKYSGVTYFLSQEGAIAYLLLYMHAGNVVASIAHELLHLRMAMAGFPVQTAPDPLAKNPKAQKQIMRIHDNLGHAFFFHEFMRLGFRSTEFVVDWDAKNNPSEEKAAAHEHLRLGQPYVRGAWLAWYLIEIIWKRLGLPDVADEVLKAGRELFPSRMNADAEWVEDWFARAQFRDPYRYAPAVNALLNQFGLPIPNMHRLHRSDKGLEFVPA